MHAESQAVPENLRLKHDGSYVPIGKIKPIDIARDDLVKEIVERAKPLSGDIAAFKLRTFADIQAFIEMSAEQYGARIGGSKGNVTLMSFDGRYKIQRAISEQITFGEQLQAAKALIDECIHTWSEGANDNIRVLVNGAFQVDKEGNISISRVFGLRALDIKDTKWLNAMQAISDAVQVVSSKAYIRIFERVGESDQWLPIPLDVAKS